MPCNSAHWPVLAQKTTTGGHKNTGLGYHALQGVSQMIPMTGKARKGIYLVPVFDQTGVVELQINVIKVLQDFSN